MKNSLGFFVFLLFLNAPRLFAQGFWGNEFPEGKIPYEPKTYVCYKTIQPVILDGKITERAWRDIPWTDSFVDIEGSLKPAPYNDT